ncbi:MAG: RecX family transcriptional regulator [Bacteroidales bacterium]|jgi:regulatory protein|nr:RecX family transcriptional regulator [Bacteroidales bacterium]
MPGELFNTALSKAMALCSQRECCRLDMLSKLEAWGVGPGDSEKIIALLGRDNFLNEQRYAEAFVRDKFRYNKWGKVKIAAHLRQKKISAGVISAALGTIDTEEYAMTLKKLLETHSRSVKAKNNYDLKGKMLRFGLSRGFESGLLYELLGSPDD